MQTHLPKEITELIDTFSRFPGIGERTALRFVLFLLQKDAAYLENLATQIENLKNLSLCPRCHNIAADSGLCKYCADPARDKTTICVVASLPELMAIEATGDFLGVYHILGGKLDLLHGVMPQNLNINGLLLRVKNDGIKEIILALNPDIPGENTILYLTRLLKQVNTPLHPGSPLRSASFPRRSTSFAGQVAEQAAGQAKITRLARGLPMGSELEYADPVTLSSALEGRQVL